MLENFDAKRAVLSTTLIMGLAKLVSPETALAQTNPNQPQIGITVTCTDQPAYGLVNMGFHPDIYVNAQNLGSVRTNLNGGTWLYVGKVQSASQDPTEARGYRVVGYSADPNSFTADMDGYINSIRGQDITPEGEIKPIKFNPGDVIGVMVRRGPYTDNLPDTEFIAEQEVNMTCPPAVNALPKTGGGFSQDLGQEQN